MRSIVFILVLSLITGCKSSGEADLARHVNDVTRNPPADDITNDIAECDAENASVVKSVITAESYYASDLYPVLDSDCMDCHVSNGTAGYTGFVLTGEPNADYQLVKELVEREVGGFPYLLMKATGFAGHTGGARFGLDSPEAKALQKFADLLGGTGTDAEPAENCVENVDVPDGLDDAETSFFDGISFLDNRETLNKATMIMLGRRATPEELAAVSDGTIESLRSTLRSAMYGPEFIEFLMVGANDQLLTNGLALDQRYLPFISLGSNDSYYHFGQLDWPGIMPTPDTVLDNMYNAALASEPLALIAFIVSNERDYREVLTADYTVFNALTYEFFDYKQEGYVQLIDLDTGEVAAPPSSPTDWVAGRFAPGVGTGYYIDSRQSRHPAAIPYPHAGVLTTRPWLARWPSTATNGNRKRAKMVMKQFLGYDIERIASRPMNGSALEDIHNPTFNNSACTGCHYQLDPLAGTFQNWGYLGRFRLNDTSFNSRKTYYRENALSSGYKSETQKRCGSPIGMGGYCEGDLWYAERFPPGIVYPDRSQITLMPDDGPGRHGANDNAALRWVSRQLVKDPRFATGTVEFWYEAIFNEKPLQPPIEGDPTYDMQLRSYLAQQAQIRNAAAVFSQDNGYGPYNLKDMLVELFVSKWFRADAGKDVSGRHLELADVGMGAILTPEQLDRKMKSAFGFTWLVAGGKPGLSEHYNVAYGGIDSKDVTVRNRLFNPLMANVIRRMVSEMSCEVVYHEFIDDLEDSVPPNEDPMTVRPPAERSLFETYNGETPDNAIAIKRTLVSLHRRLWTDRATMESPQVQESFALFERLWEYEANTNNEEMRCESNPGKPVIPIEPASQKPAYPDAAMRVWRDMLAYFMSDPMFLME